MVFRTVSFWALVLFSIYLKYIADNVSTLELHLNADDSSAFVVGDTIDQVSQLLNILRSNICSWYELERLRLYTLGNMNLSLESNL